MFMSGTSDQASDASSLTTSQDAAGSGVTIGGASKRTGWPLKSEAPVLSVKATSELSPVCDDNEPAG